MNDKVDQSGQRYWQPPDKAPYELPGDIFDAELAESSTLQQYLTAIVQLYKSLGGGWSPER